jgi:hypothetical protein
MIKTNLIPLSLGLGIAVTSLGLSQSASALQLNLVQDAPYQSAPNGWTKLGWKAEGRAGAPGTEDYEFAIGPNGAQADLTGQIYRDWTNGEEVNWSLTWNGQTVNFGIENFAPISYSLADPSPNIFNGFSLLTNVDTRPYTTFGLPGQQRVEPGTTMDLVVKTINGESVTDQLGNSVFSSSTGPTTPGENLSKKFYSSPTTITSLTGTAKMSWLNTAPNSIKARSRVDFQIQGYKVKERSVPEPSALFGLLAIGVLGAGLGLKRKKYENLF